MGFADRYSLKIDQIRGSLDLKALRSDLLQQLHQRNRMAAEWLSGQPQLIEEWFPGEIHIDSGQALLWATQQKTTNGHPAMHGSSFDLAASVGGFGPSRLTGKHQSDETLSPPRRTGELLVSSSKAGHVGFGLTVAPASQGKRDAGERSSGRGSVSFRQSFEFVVAVSLPPAELSRITNHWAEQAAAKLGIPPGVIPKINVPDDDGIKAIEHEGKEWLRSMLQSREERDPEAKAEARQRRRESERKLKEALGRMLEK
jgi:hypothetical protein